MNTIEFYHALLLRKYEITLQTAHEHSNQFKKSMIDVLNKQYELFRMKDGKSIQEMYTRLTSIINRICSLGEFVPRVNVVN